MGWQSLGLQKSWNDRATGKRTGPMGVCRESARADGSFPEEMDRPALLPILAHSCGCTMFWPYSLLQPSSSAPGEQFPGWQAPPGSTTLLDLAVDAG